MEEEGSLGGRREGAGKVRNSKVKLMWWWVGCGWYERIAVTVRLRLSCCQVIYLFRSSLSRPCQFISKIFFIFYIRSYYIFIILFSILTIGGVSIWKKISGTGRFSHTRFFKLALAAGLESSPAKTFTSLQVMEFRSGKIEISFPSMVRV